MEQRVDEREWIEFQWPYVMALLGGEGRVSELAYASGAFTRWPRFRPCPNAARAFCSARTSVVEATQLNGVAPVKLTCA